MTVLRTGSNKKYADNWGKAFGGGKKTTTTKKKAKSVKKKKKVKRK